MQCQALSVAIILNSWNLQIIFQIKGVSHLSKEPVFYEKQQMGYNRDQRRQIDKLSDFEKQNKKNMYLVMKCGCNAIRCDLIYVTCCCLEAGFY